MFVIQLVTLLATFGSVFGAILDYKYSCNFPDGINFDEIEAVEGKCYHIANETNPSLSTWWESIQYCTEIQAFLPTPETMPELMAIDDWIEDEYPIFYDAEAGNAPKNPAGFWIGFQRPKFQEGVTLPEDKENPFNFWNVYEKCPPVAINKDLWAKFQPDGSTVGGTNFKGELNQDEECVAKRRIGHDKWIKKDKGAHDWGCNKRAHYTVCVRCAIKTPVTDGSSTTGPSTTPYSGV